MEESKLVEFDVADNLQPFIEVRKKPVIVHAKQMDHPFCVKTPEGYENGKAGDYLMKGIEGELYPCDAGVFVKTYDIV